MTRSNDSTVRAIPLHGCGGGHVALIDAEDYEMLAPHKWMACRYHGKSIYAQRSIKGGNGKTSYTTIKMHRVILKLRPGEQGDHINGDTLDNRRCNLRKVTNQQNQWNRRKGRASGTPFKGIQWSDKASGWRAKIRVHGRQIYLGTFDTPEDAARAYDVAARQHFGEYAALNLPHEENSPDTTKRRPPRTKLAPEQVAEIRSLNGSMSTRAIARKFGLSSNSYVSRILRREP